MEPTLPQIHACEVSAQGSPAGTQSSGLSCAKSPAAATKSLLCDPIDGSPPGSATPGILQARVLEWVAIVFSAQRVQAPKPSLIS